MADKSNVVEKEHNSETNSKGGSKLDLEKEKPHNYAFLGHW